MKICNHYIYSLLLLTMLFSCKKQLDIGNPNAATVAANASTESGIIAFANGGVYTNGFNNNYFWLPYAYTELMGDMICDQSANQLTNQIGLPDYVILDDGTKTVNTAPSHTVVRLNNTRASTGTGNNAFYYEWADMYAMNNTLNNVLSLVDNIKFSGDAATRANTIKVWCYWWKGYLYSQIGSLYYSGIINDAVGTTNNHYVPKDSVIAESNKFLQMASTLLQSITSAGDYTAVLSQLIPSFCQVGNGGVLTTDMWTRNINSLLARNILLNKLSPFVNGNPDAKITGSSMTAMTPDDWAQVLTLATNGIRQGDYVFTGRTTETNGFFAASGGSVAAYSIGPSTSAQYEISERFIQSFQPGDKRYTNNFYDSVHLLNQVGGFTYSTRYSLIDGGQGMAGVYSYATRAVGAYELYLAVSYEENALMLAEANIRQGNYNQGLSFIDAVRAYQGAGLAPVANTAAGSSMVLALDQLASERRVALAFRNITFYDSRRWGWTYDIAQGGGTYGNINFTPEGVVNTNATLDYNFMDFWDVPADETMLNPPGSGSAPIQNPNYQ